MTVTQAKGYTIHKGVAYFARRDDAQAQADLIGTDRVLQYGRGWAVQYHKSSCYWPETHTTCQWCYLG